MLLEEVGIEGLLLFSPKKVADERGFFSETYNASVFENSGVRCRFVQDNHSLSRMIGTVRGLHFQTPPHAQDKLVRVVQGRILDVAVDLRRSSPTFGRHVAVELSRANWRQLFIPKGFAHGFVALEPDTEVLYKVTDFYSPGHESGLAWDDPDLGIDWPVSGESAMLSERDRRWPRLRELTETFA
jgi:dTDP-4-dehydrorhamnose 3,5-epimerase